MAKTKKVYSSVGLDDDIYKNPGLLKSDAMERIEKEQGTTPFLNTQAFKVSSPKEETKAKLKVESIIISERETEIDKYEPELPAQPKAKEDKGAVTSIFSKDNLNEKDFTSAILHNEILEELHELARIRDDEGRRYPVKYLASNIIRNYLQEHRKEIESIKKQAKKRRS